MFVDRSSVAVKVITRKIKRWLTEQTNFYTSTRDNGGFEIFFGIFSLLFGIRGNFSQLFVKISDFVQNFRKFLVLFRLFLGFCNILDFSEYLGSFIHFFVSSFEVFWIVRSIVGVVGSFWNFWDFFEFFRNFIGLFRFFEISQKFFHFFVN